MLGQFLEYSVAARPLAASFEFFESLGFSSIPVSDTLPDPYLVWEPVRALPDTSAVLRLVS